MTKDSALQQFTMHLPYKLPLDWPALLAFFQLHQLPGVELITDHSYTRSFYIENIAGFFEVKNQKQYLVVEVWAKDQKILPILAQKVRQLFDLDLEQNMLAALINQPLLASIFAKYPYLRIPGGFEVFETAINTILGQLISVAAARKLVAKLVSSYGQKIKHPKMATQFYLFPSPLALQTADLTNFGFTKLKITAIKELASRVVAREINLESSNFIELKKALLKVPGIGPWTVEYISMRCFADKNGFPEKDLILARYLKKYPEFKNFKTWRSYLAIYLWQHFLEERSKKYRF